MKNYIGNKMVTAQPATFGDVRKGKADAAGITFEPTSDDESPGYLVIYEDGYVSWIPKDVFEEAYRVTDGMNFGLAIEAAKKGNKISRPGWNGRGMFVVFQKGYPQGIQCNKQTADAFKINEGDLFVCNPYLQIKNVDGSVSMWVPSINDCLADDWMIVQ